MSADRDLTPSLVLRLRAGDGGAAGTLETLFRVPLQRFCLGYLGDPDEAEDAVQDVFAKVLESESVPDDFRVWLYTIARNHCLNLQRSRRRRRDAVRLPTGAIPAPSRTGFLTALVDHERQEQLEDAFAALSHGEQELLRLRYADALSRDEIASITALPVSVVKSRLYEAMKQLRGRLGSG